jgi:hypothetical protein
MAARAKKDEEAEKEADAEEASRPRARTPEESDAKAAWIEGLEEVVPGLEIVDRELSFEGGARADLVAVDPSGRLYLVLRASEDADRAVLETLDCLALVRTQLELLARHCGEGRVNPERAPRVLVVCPGSDARLVERLGVMSDVGVFVLGLRAVKSATGEHTYLVRLDPAAHAAVGPAGLDAFLRALPARLEPLGTALLERMQRLDEELACTGDATTLVWRLSGEVLVKVERIGELLQASVAPRHEPLPLADLDDLDALVERALGRLVRVLGLTRAEQPGGGPSAAAPKLAKPLMTMKPDEPILTPEEIRAFQE